jgi:predicted metal-binding membrane protein
LVGAALFQVTWIVMMAAMMLPSLVPFTIGVGRLMRAGGGGRPGTALLTLGYFAVWVATGAVAYLVWGGLEKLAVGSPADAARAGSAVLFGAAIYQLTPLKRVCLRHCRSPSLLLMQHGPQAVASRFGATRAGLEHGLYCLGCCWALMAVLLALGVMSLVWMGLVAAVIAVEKVTRYGEHISRGVGVLLA